MSQRDLDSLVDNLFNCPCFFLVCFLVGYIFSAHFNAGLACWIWFDALLPLLGDGIPVMRGMFELWVMWP